jgi:hypothetical protein
LAAPHAQQPTASEPSTLPPALAGMAPPRYAPRKLSDVEAPTSPATGALPRPQPSPLASPASPGGAAGFAPPAPPPGWLEALLVAPWWAAHAGGDDHHGNAVVGHKVSAPPPPRAVRRRRHAILANGHLMGQGKPLDQCTRLDNRLTHSAPLPRSHACPQHWRPRPGAPLFMAAKAVLLFVLAHAVPAMAAALAAAAAAAVVALAPPAAVTVTTSPPAAAALDGGGGVSLLQAVQCYGLLAGLANAGFAYTSFVTTHRRAAWRGRHGGYRDLALVNAAMPAVAAWGLLPYGSLLFPPPTPAAEGGAFYDIDAGPGGAEMAVVAPPGVNGTAASTATGTLMLQPAATAAARFALLASGSVFSLPAHLLLPDGDIYEGDSVRRGSAGAAPAEVAASALPLDGGGAAAATAWWWALPPPTLPSLVATRPSHVLSLQGRLSGSSGSYSDSVSGEVGAAAASSSSSSPSWRRGAAARLLRAYVVPVYPSLVLAGGFLVGTHLLYATRALRLDGSVTARTLRAALCAGDVASLAAIATKVGLIASALRLHGVWLLSGGGAPAAARCGAYAAVLLALWAVTAAVKPRYYVHLHHWAAGLLLSPLARGPDWGLSLGLLGLAVGQFVEGAARWSCAPLWHAKAGGVPASAAPAAPAPDGAALVAPPLPAAAG